MFPRHVKPALFFTCEYCEYKHPEFTVEWSISFHFPMMVVSADNRNVIVITYSECDQSRDGCTSTEIVSGSPVSSKAGRYKRSATSLRISCL